jgi:hypothetical protein
MTATAVDRGARRARQLRIESLLGELDERRRELIRLRAGGLQYGALRDLKRELRTVRVRLSDAVG